MTEATFWNGEPCEARKVTVEVADGEFELYWARHLVGERRDAVEVTYNDETFYLDDDAGEQSPEYEAAFLARFGDPRGLTYKWGAGLGWRKVTEGRGSPHVGHRNLVAAPGSVEPRE